MNPERGCFLVLEGIDGAGTTTQAELLAEKIESSGRRAHLTREPSTGPVGVFLRQALTHQLKNTDGETTHLDWASMALLFSADRLDHLEREILPALSRGEVVICDRYDLSGLIYQSETSPEGQQALPWLRELNRKALRPAVTLILNVAPEVAERRRATRAGEEELYEKSELQRRLAASYLRAEEFLPNDRLIALSAEGSQAEVAALIQEELLKCPEFAWLSALSR